MAKVRFQVLKSFQLRIKRSLKVYFLSTTLDFDECLTEPGPCGDNANCNNTDGSYICSCKKGFTGDGITCEGRRGVIIFIKQQDFKMASTCNDFRSSPSEAIFHLV